MFVPCVCLLFNKKEKMNSIFYAHGADVDVSVMDYSKLHHQDFVKIINDESQYLQKFTFKNGDVP